MASAGHFVRALAKITRRRGSSASRHKRAHAPYARVRDLACARSALLPRPLRSCSASRASGAGETRISDEARARSGAPRVRPERAPELDLFT